MSCLIFCVHLSICFLCFLRAKKQGIYIISPQIICHLVLCGPQIICAAGSSKTNWVHVSLGVFISTDGISLGCAHTRRWQEQPAGRSLAKVCVLLYRKLQPAVPAFSARPMPSASKRKRIHLCAQRDMFQDWFHVQSTRTKGADRHLSYLLRFHRQHIAARLFWLMAKKCPETTKEDKFPSFCRSCVCAHVSREKN